MRRDDALIPLSHQHQHALALCVRIERSLSPQRAGRPRGETAQELQARIDHLFRSEIQFHFQMEEEILFPVAGQIAELQPLLAELVAEHKALRSIAMHATAGEMQNSDLLTFARSLSEHVRKEERILFEKLQRSLSPATLAQLGEALQNWMNSSGMPGEACDLRDRGGASD